MFFIDRKPKIRQRDLAFIHIGPSIVVLVAFLGLTVWNTFEARSTLNAARSLMLEDRTIESKDEITSRLTVYENIARAGAGLFEASGNVTREEWKSFMGLVDLTDRYPGIQSMGYIKIINPVDLEQHIVSLKAEGFSNYSVMPAGVRDTYTAIYLVEPTTESNLNTIGLDSYTESIRKDAMDTAVRTGETALTDPVKALRNPDITTFTMYIPVYRKNSLPQNEEDRLRNIVGYVFAGFRAKDFFGSVASTNEDDSNYAFRLYDKNKIDEPQLYQSDSYDRINAEENKSTYTYSFTVANQEWNILGVTNSTIIQERDRNRPNTILWFGSLLSILISGLIYLLLVNRTQSFEKKEGIEIQRAKDELLALASHQLRTPATGVKQYIGMLREGYVGKLSAEQRKYINKAYESNERQLGTINEMLVVAHVGSGKMDLRYEKVDAVKLVQEILDEQASLFADKKQNLEILIPKRKIYFDVDLRYIRMAIENVITNASKYTFDQGKIKVSLHKSQSVVTIIVGDNGVGVEQSDLPLLFKKFSRIPNELTNKVTGSGIGLYLTKKIITAHNGTIEFTSRPGRGSKCILSIPLKKKMGRP